MAERVDPNGAGIPPVPSSTASFHAEATFISSIFPWIVPLGLCLTANRPPWLNVRAGRAHSGLPQAAGSTA